MKNFSVKKANDRAFMAATVKDILGKVSDGIVTDDNEFSGPRARCVSFSHDSGLSVSIKFDGDDRMDREGCFCMAWHISSSAKGEAKLSDAFGIALGYGVNQYHHRKCTAFSDGFEHLCELLQKAVELINNGRAFRPGSYINRRSAEWVKVARMFNRELVKYGAPELRTARNIAMGNARRDAWPKHV